MSKLRRASAVLVAATLSVPLWGVPTALAQETSTLSPLAGAYFYSAGIRKPDESPANIPNATAQADGVAPEHLAVAARAGQEDKVSFLLFDLFDLDPESSITSAVLTVPLAPNGDGNTSFGQAPEKVQACASGDEGFGGDDGTSFEDAPTRKCDVFTAPGKASADQKAYVFDITALAQSWLVANDGVALTAADGARTTPFQIVFAKAPEATLALTFTAPAGGSDADFTDVPLDDAFTGGTGTSGGAGFDDAFSGGSFDDGFASSPDSSFGTAEEPLISAEGPLAEPDVAGEEPLTAPELGGSTTPVAFQPASLAPGLGFWFGVVLLGGVLLLMSLIMGDARVAQAATSQTRLSRALQAREAAGRHGAGRPALGH